MPNSEKIIAWIQAFLTQSFIRLFKRSKPEEKEELSLLDEPTTVYPFRSDRALFGQATPFDTIIWNKTRTEKLSKKAKRLVLHHECSHRDRNPIYKGVFLGMAVSFAAGCLLLLKAVLALLLGASLHNLMQPTAVAFTMMGTFLVLFRIEETIADYHALCELGEEGFIDAYEEIALMSDNSLRNQIMGKLLYTHPEDTVRIYRLRQRFAPS
ncbi:M48 family metalloprotease [Halorussus limi]|uniref:M48 family metalloprotease n=1 Tax=Halorussus limi TaxID=2938695 RepID=A0A8U0HNX7_9EURY|nr:M48 family metalloprotease [Halorussus limi]UPV72725.1 M48 family metalloprotease [Halorussus limi]